MLDLLIRGATIVGPRGRFPADIQVADGRIAALGAPGAAARETIDAGGLLAIPGVVDSHVHFMDPGDTEREDFMTGSAAAAAGGTTTVIEHTHGAPVLDAKGLARKAAHLRGRSLVDFALAAHVFPDRLPALEGLWAAGPAYLKVFTCETHGVPALLPGRLLACCQAAARIGARLLVHCEDDAITRDRERELREAGRTDFGVIPLWRCREAEEVAVATVALLVRLTGARAVIAHTSHPEAVELIRRERAAGAHLATESCPQYFWLREGDVLEHGPFRKFTPPARLRTPEDAERMWALLARGDITHISTDHAPATRAQKQAGDIWHCPFGLPGAETTLTLMLQGVARGWITLERLVEVLCEQPARLYGLFPRKGSLSPGADADVTLIDMQRHRVIADAQVVSKAGWTPYAGMAVAGGPVTTFARGRLVAKDGRPEGEPGWGRWLPGPGRAG